MNTWCLTAGSLLLSILVCAGPFRVLTAGEAEPDVTPVLQDARSAWQAARAVEKRIQAGNGDVVALLKELDAAYTRAIDAYERALKQSPRNVVALSDLGRLWLSRRDLVRALDLLAAAQASDERNPVLKPSERADLHRAIGGLLERMGETPVAIERYKKAVSLNPEDARNVLSLASACAAAGLNTEALERLEAWLEARKASAAPPASPAEAGYTAFGQYTLAVVLEEAGRPEDALRMYREAFASSAGAPDWGVRERADLAIARLEDAFDRLTEREKEREAANQRLAAQNKPLLPSERELYANAVGLVRQGVRAKLQALSDPEFVRLLAQSRTDPAARDALVKAGSWETLLLAMDCFQKAIALYPRYGRSYFELGQCENMLGRYGSARKLLGEAVAGSPSSIPYLLVYGESLLDLGQFQEAAQIFLRLCSLDPESGRANLGLARALAALKSDVPTLQQAQDALERAEALGVPEDAALRKGLESDLARLERGERLQQGPVLRGGRSRRGNSSGSDALDVWRGSLMER